MNMGISNLDFHFYTFKDPFLQFNSFEKRVLLIAIAIISSFAIIYLFFSKKNQKTSLLPDNGKQLRSVGVPMNNTTPGLQEKVLTPSTTHTSQIAKKNLLINPDPSRETNVIKPDVPTQKAEQIQNKKSQNLDSPVKHVKMIRTDMDKDRIEKDQSVVIVGKKQKVVKSRFYTPSPSCKGDISMRIDKNIIYAKDQQSREKPRSFPTDFNRNIPPIMTEKPIEFT